MSLSLDDIPKKVQYMVIDSKYINRSNNAFSVNLTLDSNTHIENMNNVLGIKMVDFYVTQIGKASSSTQASNIPKYIDITCPEIPKVAQMLDERHGRLFARIPLERHYASGSNTVVKDKEWKSFERQTNYFNPMSIKQLNFNLYESQENGTYTFLKPGVNWYMVLEITVVHPKEKPKDKNVLILQALEKLTNKIEVLNMNVKKLPDKPQEHETKKYPFGYLIIAIILVLGTFIYMVNKSSPPQAM